MFSQYWDFWANYKDFVKLQNRNVKNRAIFNILTFY